MKNILFSIAFFISGITYGGVNIHTGNFYISYTDMEFSATNTILRTYNSKALFSGYFGYGWGSDMDSWLYLMPDGNLSVYMSSGNFSLHFASKGEDKKSSQQMVDEIITLELKLNKIENDPSNIMNRKIELINNYRIRAETYIRYINQKHLTYKATIPSAKMGWIAEDDHKVSWNAGRFTVNWAQDKYIFDEAGRMTEHTIRGDHKKFIYKNGRLFSILAKNFETRVLLDDQNRITSMSYLDKGKTLQAKYLYDSSGNLIFSKDAGDYQYWYQYDNYHNMTRIEYVDSTSLVIEYDPLSFFVVKIIEPDLSYSTYSYTEFNDKHGLSDPLHYATLIKRYSPTDSLTFNAYYEYEKKLMDSHDEYLYRKLIKTDSSYEENIYDAVSGNPVYRKRNGLEAWAKYDLRGRPVYLRLPDSVFTVDYNFLNRVTKFQAIDSLKKDSSVFNYLYNKDGVHTTTLVNGEKYLIEQNKKNNTLSLQTNEMLSMRQDMKNNAISYSINNGPVKTFVLERDEDDRVRKIIYKMIYALKPYTISENTIWDKLGY